MGKNIRCILEKANKGQSSRVVVYMVSQCILQGIAVIAMPVFSHLLTTEQYGRVSVYSTWVSILALIIGLRVETTISVAKVHFGEDKFDRFCINAYGIVLFTALIIFGIGLVGMGIFPELLGFGPMVIMLLMIHGFGTVATKVQSNIFLYQKKATSDIFLSISISVATLVLSVIFIYRLKGCEDIGRMLGMATPYIVLGTFFCGRAVIKIRHNYDKEIVKYILSMSIPMIFSGLSFLILNQSDRLMLRSFSGDGLVGIYSFCYTVATPISAISSALGSAWRPDYYEKLKADDQTWLTEHSNNYIFLFTSLTCGYLLVSKEALKILGAKEYWDGIDILPFVIVGLFFEFLYTFPVNYEMYCKKTKIISIGSTIAALVNIGLNFLLIPRYGMLGAAIATLIAYIGLFIIHDIIVRKIGEYHYKWSFYLKGIIPVIGCSVLTYLLTDYMPVRWGIGAVIGIVLILRIKKRRTLL